MRKDNGDTAKDMRRSFEAKKKEAQKREEIPSTKQIQNSQFTHRKVKQKHNIFNIPFTILAKKTTENIKR